MLSFGVLMSLSKIVTPPAACADEMPFSESSNIKHCVGLRLSCSAAFSKISGCGLPQVTSSPQTSTSKNLYTLALIRYSSAIARRLDVATAIRNPDLRKRSKTCTKPFLIGTPSLRTRSSSSTSARWRIF